MLRHPVHDNATSNVLAWSSSHAANVESAADEEAGADADEPPDSKSSNQLKMSPDFRRTSVALPKDNKASLLTKALQSASEGETTENTPPRSRRRRSITSDYSVASTAELTSDTGLSTRTNSPSPRLPDVGFVPLSLEKQHRPTHVQIVGSVPRKNSMLSQQAQAQETPSETQKDPAVQKIEKKRCISFACTAKPKDDAPKPPTQAAPAPAPAQAAQPRKPCIKFACPAKPTTTQSHQTPPQRERLVAPQAEDSGSLSTVVNSPSTIRKARSPVAVRRSRPSTPRRGGQSPVAARKKRYITADFKDLKGELCHFHEFASDHPQEEDWIREETTAPKRKLLMDDLLKKENDIRRIGKEAEEEAELEEEEAEEANDDLEGAEDEDDVDNADDDMDEDVIEDDQSGYGSDDDFSDGYNTDEDLLEFADSDEEDDDELALWTFSAKAQARARDVVTQPAFGPASLSGFLSDSSTYSREIGSQRHSQQRTMPMVRPMTPELPDSTDFVCGTMDEDRPLEEAYLQQLTVRKQEKLRKIPQDIDPSFPTSDPEDEDEQEVLQSHESAEPVWLHGELEELHAERPDRRRKRNDTTSPKRLRSPPPNKRYHSPPPKARGRSPRRLFDRSSPKRMKSPAPIAHPRSPAVSPTQVPNGIGFNKSLAARPGLTHAKSLPRGGYFPAHLKSGKRTRANTVIKDKTGHVRGAIDIVKGLEQKRQRRKEKFQQKHCDRARKGKIPEKKPQPGEGAERMRELGLLLAGKIGQGNYVISI